MKKLLTVFLICALTSAAQPKWQYGMEINMNAAFRDTYQRNVLRSANLFGLYRNNELYAGIDVINLLAKRVRTWGFESGYKYHFRLKNRLSNIMLDANYQFSRYCDGCTSALSYNYRPQSVDDMCLAFRRVKSHVSSCGLGYELFYTKWLSTSLTAGPAINWVYISAPSPAFLILQNRPSTGIIRTDQKFNYLIKASIRITL